MRTCLLKYHVIAHGSTTATHVPLSCLPPWLQRRTPCLGMSEGTWVFALWCSTLSMVSGGSQLDPAAYPGLPCVPHMRCRIYSGMHSVCVPLPLQLQLAASHHPAPCTRHQRLPGDAVHGRLSRAPGTSGCRRFRQPRAAAGGWQPTHCPSSRRCHSSSGHRAAAGSGRREHANPGRWPCSG